MLRSLERRLAKIEAELAMHARHVTSHDEWVIRREEERRRLAGAAAGAPSADRPAAERMPPPGE
jgi:hypothetical protein